MESFKLLHHEDIHYNADFEELQITVSETESESSIKSSILSDITSSDSQGDSESKFVVFCIPPKCCVPMSKELLQYLTKVDSISGQKGDIFSRNPSIFPYHRSLLLDWMMEICDFFRVSRETCYIAIDYLDRYLSVSRAISKDQLQLIGLTSLHIASKWEEVNAVQLIDFICLVDDLFTSEEVISMEKKILIALDCKTSFWNLNKWLFTLIHLARYPVKTDEFILLTDLLDLIVLDGDSLKFSHSVLASACIYVVTSVRVTFPEDSPSQQFEMCQCVVWIQKYWEALITRPFPNERVKHLVGLGQCEIVRYSLRFFYSNPVEIFAKINGLDLIPSLCYKIIY